MPALQYPPSDPGRPAYTAREPADEADRLDRQTGPVQKLADHGAHTGDRPSKDPSRPGADRRGRGVR